MVWVFRKFQLFIKINRYKNLDQNKQNKTYPKSLILLWATSFDVIYLHFAVSKLSINIDHVKSFTFQELAAATANFSDSNVVGRGGYGKVYKGILWNKKIVAIKRAEEGSLQGEKEFLTEIELLSRLHHRNLVSLVGYCDEEQEQVYFIFLYFLLFLFCNGN